MKKLLLTLSAFVLALIAAGSAQAITLTDLFNGASITANDKEFDQWILISQSSSEPGRTVNTDNVEVTPLNRNPYTGLHFDILNDEFGVIGDDVYAYLDFQFGFRVSVLDPKEKINGNYLELREFYGQYDDDGNNDLGIYIEEWVGTAPGLHDLATKAVTANALDGIETYDLFNVAFFPPQSQVFVTKHITVWSQDSTDFVGLTQFDQLFFQVNIPEPATLALLSLGLLGMGVVRQRLI